MPPREAFTFLEGTIPVPGDTVGAGGVTIGDLWTDISGGSPVVKVCTGLSPITFSALPGGGASTGDQFVTWASAADLTNQKVIGSFLTSVLQTALSFSRGGTVLTPTAAVNVAVWRAPFACTVTNVKGLVSGATGTTVNARRNGTLTLLAADLTLNGLDTWLDGGAVQNTATAAGDRLEIMLTAIGGAPTEVAVQVDFTRP